MHEAYEVRHPQVERQLKDIGRMLGENMLPGWGFALLMFSFGDGGSTFYASNAQRAGMIRLLDEFKARLEAEEQRESEARGDE